MKICILVPSEDHMKQAGVRIRYRRIDRQLQLLGGDLEVRPINDFRARADFVHDIYVISKCYDARAFVAAHLLRAVGKPVGIDLFDDYFSQRHDSRLTRFRQWLQTMLDLADFILCSTPAMRDIVKSFAPRLPSHVMNDPSPPVEAEAIRSAARRKLEYVRKTGILNLGWLGIGDNPYFPVGLADLAAFDGEIARLRGCGFEIRLDVLTNLRAMTGDALAMLRRLPLAPSLEEWTEEREAALLSKSFACFLPVNAQNFSVVKSLNRAVSALSAGVQVLSAGYPLYEPLSPFIYRDPVRLLKDIETAQPALREETVLELMRLTEELASAPTEARRLFTFLETRGGRGNRPYLSSDKPIIAAVIHGRSTIGDTHKFSQRMQFLSVASPFCKEKLDFDVRFSFASGETGLEVYVAEMHCQSLAADVRPLLSSHSRFADTLYWKLDTEHFIGRSHMPVALAALGTPIGAVASYPRIMAEVDAVLGRLFPGIDCYYSERSNLPLWVAASQGQERKLEVA